MRMKLAIAIAVLPSLLLSRPSSAASPAPESLALVRQWTDANLKSDATAKPPFSFVYGGKPSGDLLASWASNSTLHKLDDRRTERTTTWKDPATGLEVRCVSIEYSDFPAVEWTVYFRNTGSADTPILSDIRAINGGIALAGNGQPIVHFANGSDCRTDDFAPQSAPLGPNSDTPQGPRRGEGNPIHLQSKQGRSSCGVLPFFNVDLGGRGAICAVGWTGDWAADIFLTDRDARIRAGMVRTHLKLLPGEEIRSPKIALLFWNGDRMCGHNVWRQFVLAHHSPRQAEQPARVPISFATWGGNFAAKHIEHAKWWKEHNLPIDFLWLDAGWYGNDETKAGANVFNCRWGELVGDWFPNPGYFPNGFAPVSKAVKDEGLGFLLWFEPERAFQGTQWTREHPEFFLGPIGPNYLLNLGNPTARQALTDRIAKLLAEGKISCYRQDFNFDPRPYWDAADATDRVGMTEIQHITGLYQFWDDLLARCPGLLIDNCASGGRRIDLETMSRSVALWRSDLQCFPNYSPATTQNHTQGLAIWAPLSATICDREDTYLFRSAMGPGMDLGMPEFEKDSSKHFSIDWLRKMIGELNGVRDLFLGDFYPLLAYSASEDVWAAWQLDRPDQNAGAVLAFRRVASPFAEATLVLKGLDPNAVYVLTDVDSPKTALQMPGKQLLEKGLTVKIDNRPGAKLIMYRKNP